MGESSEIPTFHPCLRSPEPGAKVQAPLENRRNKVWRTDCPEEVTRDGSRFHLIHMPQEEGIMSWV